VKDAADSLLDHLMDMNNPSEPRMPRVEDLKLLDLMGVGLNGFAEGERGIADWNS
jgi:hypothetical protein